MKIELSPIEARVIGCLMEKQVTTPDNYPLSLNSLTSACNQKSSREPVMDLDESAVQATLDDLSKRHLVNDRAGFGGRVTKYKHRFCNTDYGNLQLSDQEFGVICVLLLRGAQSPGELRTRTARFCRFSDNDEVEQTLNGLATREEPLVAQIARQPGQRDARFMHLFFGDVEATEAVVESSASLSTGARLTYLEDVVGELRREIDEIKSLLD